MIHRRVGRKLNRTWSHKKALMCNLATDLFLHKKLVTTEAKAKELRPFAESLITRARIALRNEQNGKLPTARPNKAGEVIPVTKDFVQRRQYTRIIKIGRRRGDAAREAIIELVDFSAPQDGIVRRKKKAIPAPKVSTSAPVEVIAPVAAPIIEEIAPEVDETIVDTVQTSADAIELQADTTEVTPIEDATASEDAPADAPKDSGDASAE